MSTKKQRKKLADFRKFCKSPQGKGQKAKVEYRKYVIPAWARQGRPIPIAQPEKEVPSISFVGKAFEPKSRVEMFPALPVEEVEESESPSQEAAQYCLGGCGILAVAPSVVIGKVLGGISYLFQRQEYLFS